MPKRQLEKSNWMRRNIGSYKAKEIEGPKKTSEWIAPQKVELVVLPQFATLVSVLC